MADCDYLPYDQVCKIIDEEVAKWVYPYNPTARIVYGLGAVKTMRRFGHQLWRALEAAHLAQRERG